MGGYVIRIRRNSGNPRAEQNIRNFLGKMKDNQYKKLAVAVEIERIPELRKTVKEHSVLESVARDVKKTGTLIPLITATAHGNHMTILTLEGLLEGYNDRTRAEMPLYVHAEERMEALQRRLKAVMELAGDDGGDKNERLTAEYRRLQEERGMIKRFIELRHLSCVEEAERVKDRAKELVEMRMLNIIKQQNPDVILVYRYLKEKDLFEYRSLRVSQLLTLSVEPLRFSPSQS